MKMRRCLVYCIVLVCGVMWSNLMFAQAQISCPPPKDCKKSIVLAKKAFAAQPDCFERFDCIPQKNCDDCIMHMKWKSEISSKDALCDETKEIIPDGSTLEADLTYHIRRTGPCGTPVGTHEGKFIIKNPQGVIIATGIMKGTNGLETHVDSQECCEPLHDEGSLDGAIKTSLGVCKLKATYASELDASGTDVCSQDFWKNWTLNIDGILLCPCIPCPDFIGCWDMKGNFKVCVSGVGCQSTSGNTCLQAFPDGSFDSLEEVDVLFSGTWSETTKCKKVRADFDKDEIAEFQESLCLELGGVFCDATVSTAEALVTLVDNSRVSGTLKFAGTLLVEGRTFNWTTTGGFTGVRTANCASISALRDTSNPMLTDVARQIFSMIK